MENSIEIKLRTMASRVYPLRVDAQITISCLKEVVTRVSLIPPQLQRIIYAGRVLRDERSLLFYNIRDGHTLHLVSLQPDAPSGQSLHNQPATDPPSVGSGTTEDNLVNAPVANSPSDMQALFMELRHISQALDETDEHLAPLGPTRQRLIYLPLLSWWQALSGWIEEQAGDPDLYDQRIETSARNLDLQLSGLVPFIDGLRTVQARALLRRPTMTPTLAIQVGQVGEMQVVLNQIRERRRLKNEALFKILCGITVNIRCSSWCLETIL